MSEIMGNKRPAMEKTLDTLIIENRLRNAAVGDTVTYEELSTLLGRDVRKFCKSGLDTARKSVMADGLVFANVYDVGYKRLDDSGKLCAARSHIDRAGRQAKKSRKILTVTDMGALNDEEKKRCIALRTNLQVVEFFTTLKAQRKIAKSVAPTDGRLDFSKTLELFIKPNTDDAETGCGTV